MRLKWTEARIISEIQRVCTDSEKLRPKWIRKHHYNLYMAAVQRGGWGLWVEKAGFTYHWGKEQYLAMSRLWSRERIISEIKRHCTDEASLRPTAMLKSYSSLYYAAQKMGGWAYFVREAGLKYTWGRQTWTRQKIITLLQEAYHLGIHVTRRNLLTHPRYRGVAVNYAQYFKKRGTDGVMRASWSTLLSEAGIPPVVPVRGPYYWTEEKILEAIREMTSLVQVDVEEEKPGLVAAARRKYGGWYQALEHFGIKVKRPTTSWSKEKIIAELKKVPWKGVNSSQLQKMGLAALEGAARRYFGSLEAAWDAAK